MKSKELKNRTKEFAHRCVKLAVALPDTQLGYHIRGQLIRCSTSVASNYQATCIVQSKASFISKLSIVLEEADESNFWLEFIVDEGLLKKKFVAPLLKKQMSLPPYLLQAEKLQEKSQMMINNYSSIFNRQSSITRE